MFFNKVGKPTKIKRAVYLFSTTILGILLSFIAHAIIEMSYLSWALDQGRFVKLYGQCALHPVIQAGIWLIGAVGGFYLGKYWWRKLYIERVWLKNRA